MAQKINVKVAGHTFTMTVSSQEEEQIYRLAAESINSQFSDNTRKYQKSAEEVLAMIALSEAALHLGCQREVEALEKSGKNLEGDLKAYLGGLKG